MLLTLSSLYPPLGRGSPCNDRRGRLARAPILMPMPAPDDHTAAAGTSPRLAFLGPAGTFTEQAARSLAPKLVPSIAPAQATGDQAPSVALEPCSTVTVALDLVRSGEVAGAVVPIEDRHRVV